MDKRVTVHLLGGASVEHQLIVASEQEFQQQIQRTLDTLQGFPEGLLFFTSPTYGMYPVVQITGLEFHDPPQEGAKPTMGFLARK